MILIRLTVIFFIVSFSATAISQAVPENAYVRGNNWFCNSGYQRNGNSCQQLDVPVNAYVRGNNWFCNSGYQRIGNRCIELSQAEQDQLELLREFQIIQQSSRSSNISGLSFSLRDIERRCEVYKYSDDYGELECRGAEYRIVERRCEAYFSGGRNGVMECTGDLRPISGRCSIDMYSDNYGSLSC